MYYAVHKKTTGEFLPQLSRKRGYTHAEPTGLQLAIPRLHMSKSNARRALQAWVAGKWYDICNINCDGEPDYSGPEPKEQPDRCTSDFEIVPVILVVELTEVKVFNE